MRESRPERLLLLARALASDVGTRPNTPTEGGSMAEEIGSAMMGDEGAGEGMTASPGMKKRAVKKGARKAAKARRVKKRTVKKGARKAAKARRVKKRAVKKGARKAAKARRVKKRTVKKGMRKAARKRRKATRKK